MNLAQWQSADHCLFVAGGDQHGKAVQFRRSAFLRIFFDQADDEVDQLICVATAEDHH